MKTNHAVASSTLQPAIWSLTDSKIYHCRSKTKLSHLSILVATAVFKVWLKTAQFVSTIKALLFSQAVFILDVWDTAATNRNHIKVFILSMGCKNSLNICWQLSFSRSIQEKDVRFYRNHKVAKLIENRDKYGRPPKIIRGYGNRM